MKFLLFLSILVYSTPRGWTALQLSPFGSCVIQLDYLDTPELLRVRDLMDELLFCNRQSLIKLRNPETPNVTALLNPYKRLLKSAKCVLNTIVTIPMKRQRNANLEEFEYILFNNIFSYRSDFSFTIILLRPTSSISLPQFTHCNYSTISVRIFSIDVEYSYKDVVPSIIDTR
ncbi:hypothetical protein Fcan01_28336 [Folsomia candida]|uniref:Uncharacterized protein n=1 Tax=Folsomia candida TaxID=158441 RepID=A0A226CXY9_FOLCA|nr:hypothetical protein Fcan01_28336 [Folsomia candida]